MLRGRRLDLALAASLFAMALAIRLPYLLLTPRYSDEFQQVFWALDIVDGRRLPLTGWPPYFGPLFSYLIAACVRLFGPSVLLPRLTVAIIGALTAATAYLGGRLMWGRLAGVVAAGLVASCPVLVFNSSHYAWPNSLAPFFVAAAVVCLYASVAANKAWLLAAAALFGAFALQSHPTSAFPLLGASVWFLFRRGPLTCLKSKSTYIALAVAFLATLPWIIGLVQTGSTTFSRQVSLRDYAFLPVTSLAEYARRLPDLIRLCIGMLGGSTDGKMSLFLLAVFGILFTAGLVLAATSGRSLLSAVFLSSILLLPTVAVVGGGVQLRYIAFIAPIAFICIGGLAERAASWARPRVAMASRAYVYPAFGLVLLSAGTVYPLPSIRTFYATAEARSDSNADYFSLLNVIRTNQACGPSLFVAQPPDTRATSDYWRGLKSIHYTLLLSGCLHTFGLPKSILDRMKGSNYDGWLVIAQSADSFYSQYMHLDSVAAIAPFPAYSQGPFVLFRTRAAGPVISSGSLPIAGERLK